MLKKILLILTVLLLTSFLFFYKGYFNENIGEGQKVTELVIGNEKIEVIKMDVFDKEGRPDKEIVIKKKNGDRFLLDTYNFMGFSDANIVDIFSYRFLNTDLIISIISWDATNKALGVYGDYYEIHIYLPSGKKYEEIDEYFEPGTEGQTQNGITKYKFKTKGAVIEQLQKIEFERL